MNVRCERLLLFIFVQVSCVQIKICLNSEWLCAKKIPFNCFFMRIHICCRFIVSYWGASLSHAHPQVALRTKIKTPNRVQMIHVENDTRRQSEKKCLLHNNCRDRRYECLIIGSWVKSTVCWVVKIAKTIENQQRKSFRLATIIVLGRCPIFFARCLIKRLTS